MKKTNWKVGAPNFSNGAGGSWKGVKWMSVTTQNLTGVAVTTFGYVFEKDGRMKFRVTDAAKSKVEAYLEVA